MWAVPMEAMRAPMLGQQALGLDQSATVLRQSAKCIPWPAPQGNACGFWQGKVLAGRKPLLLFRYAGALLLRLAERTFDA